MQKINKYGRIVSTYTWALTASVATFSGSNNYRLQSLVVLVDDDVNTTIQLCVSVTGYFVPRYLRNSFAPATVLSLLLLSYCDCGRKCAGLCRFVSSRFVNRSI